MHIAGLDEQSDIVESPTSFRRPLWQLAVSRAGRDVVMGFALRC